MTILALDCATQTGWAICCRNGSGNAIKTGTVSFARGRGETIGVTFLKFTRWLREVMDTWRPDVVAYEKPHHRGGAATEVGIGMSALVQQIAVEYGCDILPVHTSTLKKAVTGSGRASKQEVMDYFTQMVGRKPVDDNEADAYALVTYAVKELVG